MGRHAIASGADRHRLGWLLLSSVLALALAGTGQAGAQEQPPPASEPTPPIDEVAAAAAAEALFKRLDRDHDQQLSLDEFKTALPARRQGVVYQRLAAHFRTRDADQSGFLEAGEFATLLALLQAGSSAPTLQAADSNGDDRLDFREYALLMAKLDGALP